ncbi:NAD(P)-dependent oxidoreductase [Luteolibacter ambystomatis]|uniref:NAD(P)-dependent oxidoreductase n=1 Tax=Luteolibacter ambystomatis TaxID=2824561 RepID=A0A975G7K4_9BACT|nr:NAD(P)-dependent oxidoreductase [Luteolibacter ambystomatis]QUE50231.1 NAD(P)-dependent oxidoreductase [Luteolibacter ambystomatis]
MSSPQTAIVTGVTGFIGNHLARRLLAEGWKVAAIVRSTSDRSRIPEGCAVWEYDGSTTDMLRVFEMVQPDTVFHLASRIITNHAAGDVESLVASNLLFGMQLLEGMRATGCKRFVNTGTGWQHFENNDYDPVCLYAATKQAFEDLLEYYVRVSGVKAVTLKLHDTYGEDDPRGKLITLLLNAARNQTPLELSPGEQKIDLVHVRDVAEAYLAADRLLRAATEPCHQRYMLRAGSVISIRELAATIGRVTGSPVNAHWGARPYREREVMLPSDLGEAVPGWKPSVTLEEGIRELWEQKRPKGV